MTNNIGVLAGGLGQIAATGVHNAFGNSVEQCIFIIALVGSQTLSFGKSLFDIQQNSIVALAINHTQALPTGNTFLYGALIANLCRQSVNKAASSCFKRHITSLGVYSAKAQVTISLLNIDITIGARI